MPRGDGHQGARKQQRLSPPGLQRGEQRLGPHGRGASLMEGRPRVRQRGHRLQAAGTGSRGEEVEGGKLAGVGNGGEVVHGTAWL